MKNKTFSPSWLVKASAIMVLAIFLIKPGAAQDKPPKDVHKTVKVKVIKEADGKMTVIDTTITGKDQMSPQEINELIARMQDQMKDLQSEMQNIPMNIGIEMGDSLTLDSLPECFKGCMRTMDCCKGIKDCCKGMKNWLPGERCLQGFKFNFDSDSPEFPDRLMMLRGFGDDESGSLNDLLGKIPMERVKGYSVKDRKNGKRIIIDIDNAPFFGLDSEEIIIKKGKTTRQKHSRNDTQEKQIRVIINTDDDESPHRQ